MKRFLDEDFLLDSKTAVDLYQGFARRQPIIDYHCHLSPHQIADDHRWRSLTEIWLDGDHYKWRAMRAAGDPRTPDHRRRVGRGEVRRVGVGRAADAAQPALPLDAPGAGVPVRRARQAAGPRHRSRDLRALQPAAGRARVHGAGDARSSSACASSAAPTIPSTIWSRTGATRPTPAPPPSCCRPGARTRRWRCTTRPRGTSGSTSWPPPPTSTSPTSRAFATRSPNVTPSSTSAGAARPITAWSGSTPRLTPRRRPPQRSPRRAPASRCRLSRSKSCAPRSATTSR